MDQTQELSHVEECLDEVPCLTVEDSDDDDDDDTGERVVGQCSKEESVFEGAVSSVQLSESSSWYRNVETPSLDQLVIPRGDGQEDLHLSPPLQLRRQTGYINLPHALSDDMHSETQAEHSMSCNCLFIPDSVTNHECSDINHTSSFSACSNWTVHKRSNSIHSTYEEQKIGRILPVKGTKFQDNSSTPPQDTLDIEPPLSPLHVPTPQRVLPIPRSKRHLHHKPPAPLPSPPVPPRRASLRRSAKSPCSCYSIPKQRCSPSSTAECSHYSTSATRDSSTTLEYSGHPCSTPGVSPSVIHSTSYTDPGFLMREPSPLPPPLPPKTYKSSLPLTTAACTATDGPSLPPHRRRQSNMCSSTGACGTQASICGCGTCSLCKFEQVALQMPQLLHATHTPHTLTAGGCIIVTWPWQSWYDCICMCELTSCLKMHWL